MFFTVFWICLPVLHPVQLTKWLSKNVLDKKSRLKDAKRSFAPYFEKIMFFLPHLVHILFYNISQLLNLDRLVIKKRCALAKLCESSKLVPSVGDVLADRPAACSYLRALPVTSSAFPSHCIRPHRATNRQEFIRSIFAHVFWSNGAVLRILRLKSLWKVFENTFNSGFVEVLSVLAQAGVEESVLEVPAAWLIE